MTNKHLALPQSEKKIIEIDYSDFEDFVSKYYGQDFEFVADQTTKNDTVESFGSFNKMEKLPDIDQKQLDLFIETGKHNLISGIILQDLVNKGVIAANSEILVDVSW